MALYIKEFHNRILEIPFARKTVDSKGKEVSQTFTSTFKLDTSEVDPKVTIFSFLAKVQTEVKQEPMEIVNLFAETGIKILVKIKNKEEEVKEKGEFRWSQTFPRLLGTNSSDYVAVARDIFLCNQLTDIILKQYIADNEMLNESLCKEFENFQ